MTDNANLDSLWDKYYGPDIVSSVEDGLVNIDDPLDILIQSLDFEENDMISGVGDTVVRNLSTTSTENSTSVVGFSPTELVPSLVENDDTKFNASVLLAGVVCLTFLLCHAIMGCLCLRLVRKCRQNCCSFCHSLCGLDCGGKTEGSCYTGVCKCMKNVVCCFMCPFYWIGKGVWRILKTGFNAITHRCRARSIEIADTEIALEEAYWPRHPSILKRRVADSNHSVEINPRATVGVKKPSRSVSLSEPSDGPCQGTDERRGHLAMDIPKVPQVSDETTDVISVHTADVIPVYSNTHDLSIQKAQPHHSNPCLCHPKLHLGHICLNCFQGLWIRFTLM